MNIIQSADSPAALATHFAKQLDRQHVLLHAFDCQDFLLRAFDRERFQGSSLFTSTKYLMDQILGMVRNQTVSRPDSFSIFGRSTLQPWFTGQDCVCILIGGADEPYYGSWHEAIHGLLRGLPGYVEGEGVRWRDEKNYLLAYYDHPKDTLHLSAPLVAVFLPYLTNMEQTDSGTWVFTGIRQSVDGDWVVDGVTEEYGRYLLGWTEIDEWLDWLSAIQLKGRAEIDERYGWLFDIHLERLSADTIRRLYLVKAISEWGEGLFWRILMQAHTAAEVELFLAKVLRLFPKLHPRW